MSDRVIQVNAFPLADQVSISNGMWVTYLTVDQAKQLYCDLSNAIGWFIDGDGGKPVCEAP